MSAPAEAPRLIVTCATDHGTYWTARVTAGGETENVDNRYGSWQAVRPGSRNGDTIRLEVRPHVAAALQQRVGRKARRGNGR